MKETFKEYTTRRGLKLVKIIENKNKRLTLYFDNECSNKNEITNELEPYFSFANGIEVEFQEKEEKADNKKSLQKAFSLEEYQNETLNKRKEEISLLKKTEKTVHEPKLTAGEMICGKKITVEPRAIEEIDFTETVNENNVCIEGDVFDVDIKDISDKSELYTIALTDYTGSIYLKRFNPKTKEKQRELLEKYTKPGNRLKVFGNLEYDDFLSTTRNANAV